MPLRIGGKDVIKLSGPTSVNIFYPSELRLQLFPKAPIFIILGDYHQSNKNYCIPIEDEKEGHYKVDGGFLKLLSDAVGDNEIVDFYLEGGPFHREVGNGRSAWPKDTPMNDLWQVFNKCYNNPRMGRKPDEESGCGQIKNIRWQSSDIRYFGDYDGIQYVRYYLSQIIKDARAIKEGKERDEYFIQRFMAEIINSWFFENYKQTVLLNKEEFIYKYLGYTETQAQTSNPRWNESVKTELKKFDNLIKKQLIKINEINKMNGARLREEFENYIDMGYERSGAILNLKVYYEIINAIKGLYSSEIYTYLYNGFKESILNFFNRGHLASFMNDTTIYLSVIPDIYILARSHKIMLKSLTDGTENNYPLINVIYYGDHHAKNLCAHLLKINYTNEMSAKTSYGIDKIDKPIRDDPAERCISFEKGANLDKLVEELKSVRSKQKKR